MTAPQTVPGYPSISAAAGALGVSRAAIRNHLREHGTLAGLKRNAEPVGRPVQMPDGSVAPSVLAAASPLGVGEETIGHHLRTYGHLKFAQTGQRRSVTLDRAPWEVEADFAPRHETAPRHRGLVATPRVPGEELLAALSGGLE